MEIDPKIAQAITANIKDLLHHEINFFNTSGTIIASTDKSRVGTSHDGARLAVSLKETVAIDSEHQFVGARDGINIPVMLDDDVIAVIGITGTREEVEPYGNIIRKITEILIRENLDQVTRSDRRLMMTNLLSLLSSQNHDVALIHHLARTLDVDVKIPRRAVVGRVLADDPTLERHQDISRVLQDIFAARPDVLYSVTPQECAFYFPDGRDDVLHSTLRAVQTSVRESYGITLVFGVGDVADTASSYWQSYAQADTAADWQLFVARQDICAYDGLDYGILLSSMPASSAEQFVSRVFHGLSSEEIDLYEKTFQAYTLHNGSILHAADDLYLHKNTLQNHLNKIAHATGYNPRTLEDYVILNLAFKMRRYLAFEQQRRAE
ncbi:hypothetical protein B9G54_02575 [Alloscardovia macacae]|uniref:Sugar diacid recognition n=1 Tax=Alloscardovia macacae TaxID=1160091 RepID=A0A1Y2T027_9BIFI|nr:sugar diacid recognition domain-containing protein [Alloscardovia macacae]OTA26934.1 hypothetical protein B9G54_02575 [Alloscardovia macacae]OTA30077.1 hypothetical protein B9T39_01575 [Alloscardovia macacae]